MQVSSREPLKITLYAVEVVRQVTLIAVEVTVNIIMDSGVKNFKYDLKLFTKSQIINYYNYLFVYNFKAK